MFYSDSKNKYNTQQAQPIPIKSPSLDQAEIEKRIYFLDLSIGKLKIPSIAPSYSLQYLHSTSTDTLCNDNASLTSGSVDTLQSHTSSIVDDVKITAQTDRYAAYLHFARFFEKKNLKREREPGIEPDDRPTKIQRRPSF